MFYRKQLVGFICFAIKRNQRVRSCLLRARKESIGCYHSSITSKFIAPATKTENKISMYHLAGLLLTAFLGNSDTATKLSAENRGKECHRFWLRYTVNLISNDRTSASKKINQMALIRTLTVSTVAFERKKEELYGFRQTVKGFDMTDLLNNQQFQKPGIHMNVLKGVNRKEKAGNFGKSQPSWFHQADFTIEKSNKHWANLWWVDLWLRGINKVATNRENMGNLESSGNLKNWKISGKTLGNSNFCRRTWKA